MAERMGAAWAPQGLRTKIEVRDGSEWRLIRGLETASHDAGSRSATTINAFEGVSSTLGPKTIEPVEFAVSMYLPHLPVYSVLEDADEKQKALIFRVTGMPNEIVESEAPASGSAKVYFEATPTVSIRGKAIFAGEDNPGDLFRDGIALVGHVVVADLKNYVIESVDVDSDGVLTGAKGVTVAGIAADRRSSANVATVLEANAVPFQIYEPGLRFQFGAKIEKLFGFSVGASADQPFQSSITVRPTAPIGRGSIVFMQDAA